MVGLILEFVLIKLKLFLWLAFLIYITILIITFHKEGRQFSAETVKLPKIASHPLWIIVMQMRKVSCQKGCYVILMPFFCCSYADFF